MEQEGLYAMMFMAQMQYYVSEEEMEYMEGEYMEGEFVEGIYMEGPMFMESGEPAMMGE